MLKKIFLLVIFLLIFNYSFAEQSTNVLFDEGHGQAFVISKDGKLHLSKLADILKKEGIKVSSSNITLSPELLSNFQTLIISGPFKPFSKEEIDNLVNFVQAGGKLFVMLHISQPAKELFEKFGLTITNGAVSEKEDLATGKNTDFFVKDFLPHPITKNIKKFAVYGSWGLVSENKDVKLIATSSINSWIDLNRNGVYDEGEPKGPFGIVATGELGRGTFVFFADDAIFQNSFINDANLELAENLAKFLKE